MTNEIVSLNQQDVDRDYLYNLLDGLEIQLNLLKDSIYTRLTEDNLKKRCMSAKHLYNDLTRALRTLYELKYNLDKDKFNNENK